VPEAEPYFWDLSERILAAEGGDVADAATIAAAWERVVARLYQRFTGIFGRAGFYSLVVRTLLLVRLPYPWLTLVQAELAPVDPPEHGICGLGEASTGVAPEEVHEAARDFLIVLFDLTATLIGPSLETALVREVWPEVGDVAAGGGAA
jgi:hypothetical protein